eukprot:2477512-Pleurochrysis_carterae.AAC.1
MRKWAALALPRSAVGGSLAAQVSSSLHAGRSLFREDLELAKFIDLFLPVNPELVRFRDERFAFYLHQSELCKLDEKPSPTSILLATHSHLGSFAA